MTILAVDSQGQRLETLIYCLKNVFPEDEILAFTDPMLAVKYSFSNAVDLVFTDVIFKRIDSLTMAQGVRKKNDCVKIYFMSDTEEHRVLIKKNRDDGYLLRPITEDAIRHLAI